MTPEISSFDKLQKTLDKMNDSFENFLKSLLNAATYNPASDSYTIVLDRRTFEGLKEVAYGGSVQVPGATGVPGAPTTVPHQTPAPHGDKADDGRSG